MFCVPAPSAGLDTMRCVLRIRYNTTTTDFDQYTTDYRNNCNPNDNQCTNSPIADRDNREALTYVSLFDSDPRYNLSFAGERVLLQCCLGHSVFSLDSRVSLGT